MYPNELTPAVTGSSSRTRAVPPGTRHEHAIHDVREFAGGRDPSDLPAHAVAQTAIAETQGALGREADVAGNRGHERAPHVAIRPLGNRLRPHDTACIR